MTWEKVPAELIEALSDVTEGLDAQRRLMFGYPCYFVNGNMFLGAYGDGAIVRLPRNEGEQALGSIEGIVPFEPIPGRTMKEYIVVPEAVYRDRVRFENLVRHSLEYVRSLPPKQKSGSRRRPPQGEAAKED